MSVLSKREPRFSREFRAQHHAANAFHSPQREHAEPVQHPKPRCGMCGGKIHTRIDYRAPDPSLHMRRTYGHSRKSDWWLCASCA